MIHPLRRVHRAVMLALAILLPLALAAAVLGRPAVPVQRPWLTGAAE